MFDVMLFRFCIIDVVNNDQDGKTPFHTTCGEIYSDVIRLRGKQSMLLFFKDKDVSISWIKDWSFTDRSTSFLTPITRYLRLTKLGLPCGGGGDIIIL